jgi:RNase P/RNase MRP subunit POP5
MPSPVTPNVRTDASVLTAYKKPHRRIRAALSALRKPTQGRVFVRASW